MKDDAPVLGEQHRKLWRYLKVCARGRDGAVTRVEICANLSDPGTDVGRAFAEMPERAFKRLTKELLAAGFPCYSNEQGYYAAQDAGDRLDFNRYVRKLAMPILDLRRQARLALEAERCRAAGDPEAFQVVAEPTPDRPRRRVLEPVGFVAQPVAGQMRLA
jgi:hypothetical protein